MNRGQRPRTYVYVDGFNLYYGGLRGSRHKWLNLRALLERVMKRNEIEKIWYFTALVKARPGQRDHTINQRTYVRALETLPGLEVEYGFFRNEAREMRRADDQGTLKMQWSKEKGSDVNLATRLMDDFHSGRFEAAAVLSNDSDQVTPVRLINECRTCPVGIVIPPRWKDSPATELKEVAAFRYRITETAVRESQFPGRLLDHDGKRIHKPDDW